MAAIPPIVRFKAWLAEFAPARMSYGWLALALAVGLAGTATFLAGHLPLPWMLGPMVLAMVVALAGVPLVMPQAVRAPMLVILGVMVGSTATPDLLSRIPEWLISLAGLVVVLFLGTAAGFVYFRKLAGYNAATAFFASVPGGLTEMILQSENSGGDQRLVALAHAVRITVVVLFVPFMVQFMSGISLGTRPPAGVPLLDLPPGHVLWFVATYCVGLVLASLMRSATALFLAPMLVSAMLHGSGITDFAIPREAGLMAQLIVGLSLGCRFHGMQLRMVGSTLLWAAGASVLLIAVAVATALLVGSLAGEGLIPLFLAYAPGGVAEMSLIAVALHAEVAFVVLHHLVRLLLVSTFAKKMYEISRKYIPMSD